MLAAHGDDFAGQEGGVLAGQEGDHVGHLPDLRTATEHFASAQFGQLLVGHDLVEEGMDGQAGRHSVDAHAVGGGLDRAATGERHHAGLGRRVVGLARLGPPPEHRRIVDDHPSLAPGVEVPEGGAGAAEGPGQRHVQDQGPLCVGHVHDIGLAAEARVVDGHVEPAVVLYGCVVEALHLGLHGHVAGHGQGADTGELGQLGQGVGRLSEPAVVCVGDDHGGAFFHASLGGGEPDARAGRRGDHDDLAVEEAVPRGRDREAGTARGSVGHLTPPLGSGGSPRTRSPMMFLWISFDPP